MTDISYKSPDGLTLYAKAYGPADAPVTALCMHGLTRNHKDFEPMIAALGGHYRFIAVDVRGRGQSAHDPAAENYSPAIYAEDMRALLDHLGLSRAALIGTSMGGLMSMIMMKTMPERVSGVVLNDVGPALERAGLRRIAAYAGKVAAVANWQTAADDVARVQANIFPAYKDADWMAFARRTYREQIDGSIILDYDPAITRSIGEVTPGLMTRIAMWRLFKSMRAVPLLIIRGAMSDILSEKTAQKMKARHRYAELVTVPNVGHAPMLDEPVAVQAIAKFLKRLETTA